MFELFEMYDPDDLFIEEDSFYEEEPEEDLHELSFEDERDALEGFSFLTSNVESPEELFATG